MKISLAAALIAAAVSFPAFAQEEPIDYDMINRIADEGFNRSHVMETLTYLTDDIGPRLANSPGMREAARWTRDEFTRYGLKNAQFDYFEFGRGWSYDSITVHMTAPRRTQLQAMPVSWHAGTNGPVEGEVLLASIESKKDLEKYQGKLAGKVVLLSKAREQDEPSQPIFTRLKEEDLERRAEYRIPDRAKKGPFPSEKFRAFAEERAAFLKKEGALAMVTRSSRDAGLLNASGYFYKNGSDLPAIVVASEDYDRMARLAGKGETVRMEIDVKAQFHDEDTRGQNVIAEIPGRGSKPEIVMAGAHLDSWFMGDGAVDNGAGSAVVMEAARILSAIGAKPKRTIRFALWDAEEEGLHGSTHYVEKTFASKPANTDPERADAPRARMLGDLWPVKPGPEYERLSGYFNLDNGSGRIRGIYGEGNVALQPVFERWFEPFHDYGAATVGLGRTGGTDHLPFQAMGLPGFQFIQDPLDYGSRLHHTDLDTASHVYEKDLQQAAVIMASFLWHAANRDERLPRMPVPTEPFYQEDAAD